MDLEHVGSKIQWPEVSKDQSQQLIAILGDTLAPLATIKDPKDIPDLFEHVTIGFNSTMAAIEDPEKPLLAVFVCKQEVGPILSNLFELPSVALKFKLVELPSHQSLAVSNGIVGVRKSLKHNQIEQIVAQIPETTSSWVYTPANLVKRQRNPARSNRSRN